MTTEFQEIFHQQQAMIRDLTEQVAQRNEIIAELRGNQRPQEKKISEATASEMDRLYR